MFRGAELPRLIAGIVLLLVIVLLMVRLRDPGMWLWVAPQPLAVSQEPTQEPPKALPAATGPTDEDPDQAAAAREEFQVIVDGSLQIQREEMEPYDRLVEWVKNQSFARLDQRATKGLRYTDLYDDAEKHRGELVALDLDVRLAGDAGENRYGAALHDAWAVTDESRGRLYSLVVIDYPPEMPIGYNIHAKAKFAGYFFKLQGYEPASAKPGQAPENAPLLIGRLEWTPSAAATLPLGGQQEWLWGLVLLAVIALVFGFRWMYHKSSRQKPASYGRIPEPASGEVVPIEQWLDQSDFDEGSDSDRAHAENDNS